MSMHEFNNFAANDSDHELPSTLEDMIDMPSNKIWHRAHRAWKASWSHKQFQKFKEYMKGTWGYKVFKRMDEYKFFPKFMAARGGLTAMVMGGFMMAGLVVSGVSAMAITLAATGLGLVIFGSYGALTYGGRLLGDAKRKFDEKVLKKEPKPRKAPEPEPENSPKRKKILTPWERIAQTESWKKFNEIPAIKKIKSSAPYRFVEDLKIWTHMKNIGQDQEVRLRAFATTGSLAMVVATGAILATQVIALPVLTISAASIFALYMGANLVGGLIALGSHGTHFVRSIKNAVKESIKEHRHHKKTPKPPTMKKAIENTSEKLSAKKCANDFEKAKINTANDNEQTPKAPKNKKAPKPPSK